MRKQLSSKELVALDPQETERVAGAVDLHVYDLLGVGRPVLIPFPVPPGPIGIPLPQPPPILP